MKKGIGYLLIITFCMILVSSSPSRAGACSCAESPSVEDELERSQAVFSGKVLEIRENRNLIGARTKSVLFEVANTWKGVKQSQIIIKTGQGGGDCGIDFIEGVEYLVYAHESDMYGAKSLVSIMCDRTNKLSSSKEDLEILGEGKPPVEKVDLTEKQEGNLLYLWVAIFIFIGLGLFFIIKRLKKSSEN